MIRFCSDSGPETKGGAVKSSATRYGGEEFVIILQDTDMIGVIKVAQNIQNNIKQLKKNFRKVPVYFGIKLLIL